MFLSDTYQQATEHVERQRIMRTPPVYNPARINELTIPNINPPCRNLAIEFDNEAMINPIVIIERLIVVCVGNAQRDNNDYGDEFNDVHRIRRK